MLTHADLRKTSSEAPSKPQHINRRLQYLGLRGHSRGFRPESVFTSSAVPVIATCSSAIPIHFSYVIYIRRRRKRACLCFISMRARGRTLQASRIPADALNSNHSRTWARRQQGVLSRYPKRVDAQRHCRHRGIIVFGQMEPKKPKKPRQCRWLGRNAFR